MSEWSDKAIGDVAKVVGVFAVFRLDAEEWAVVDTSTPSNNAVCICHTDEEAFAECNSRNGRAAMLATIDALPLYYGHPLDQDAVRNLLSDMRSEVEAASREGEGDV